MGEIFLKYTTVRNILQSEKGKERKASKKGTGIGNFRNLCAPHHHHHHPAASEKENNSAIGMNINLQI